MSDYRVVTISEVNLQTGVITMKDQFGTLLQVSLHANDIPIIVPTAGETWIAESIGHDWFLNRRFSSSDPTPITNLQPGDAKFEAVSKLYLSGQDVLINNVSYASTISSKITAPSASENQVLTYSGTAWQANQITNANISASAAIGIAKLAGYPSDSTKALRGDGTWGTLAAPAGASNTLTNRPAASAATSTFFWASDQAVLYFSNGSTWLRMSMPAGSTTMWYSTTIPTGWVAYDGTSLAASTGIYADLYAHLGNTTTTPDTRGRVLVAKGTHTDVATLGNSDGQAVGNRRPKHQTSNGLGATHGLTLPDHSHSLGGAAYASGTGQTGPNAANSALFLTNTAGVNSTPAINGTVSITGTIGTANANDAFDAPSYIVFTHIAKL